MVAESALHIRGKKMHILSVRIALNVEKNGVDRRDFLTKLVRSLAIIFCHV